MDRCESCDQPSAANEHEKVVRRMIEDRNRYAALQGFHPEHTVRQEAAALEWLLANQRTGRIIHGDADDDRNDPEIGRPSYV